MLTRISEAVSQAWRNVRWHVVRPIQRLFTGYSYDMAWDPNHHMAKKIYPIFRRYANIPPHGAPTHTILENNKKHYIKLFDKERVEQYLKTGDDEELEKQLFAHWKEIIDHVLFAIEWVGIKQEEYPEHLYDPNPNYDPNQNEPFRTIPCEDHSGYLELIFNEDYGETKLNSKRAQEFEQYISKGFELLGLYWRSFWD